MIVRFVLWGTLGAHKDQRKPWEEEREQKWESSQSNDY